MNKKRTITRAIIKKLNLVIAIFAIGLICMGTHPFAKVNFTRPGEINTTTDKFSEGGTIRVTYYVDQKTVPMYETHSWRFVLENKKGLPIKNAKVFISPDMPEHLHGMATKPKVVETTTPGEYRIDGLNFHMPGWWEVTMDISTSKTRDLVRFQLVVGEDLPSDK